MIFISVGLLLMCVGVSIYVAYKARCISNKIDRWLIRMAFVAASLTAISIFPFVLGVMELIYGKSNWFNYGYWKKPLDILFDISVAMVIVFSTAYFVRIILRSSNK